MKNIDYNALFELEAGEKETEPADPSPAAEDAAEVKAEAKEETAAETETKEAEGAKEQEVAEPEGQKEVQSRDERGRFAAARRKAEAERDKAIEAERARLAEENEKYLDSQIASLGLKDPYTGELITGKAQLEALSVKKAEERKKEILRESGMTEDRLNEYVGALPEVRQARAAVQELSRQKQKLVLDEQLAAISRIDPGIRSINDLMEQDNYQEIYALVKRGYTLTDAFKSANFDRLTASAAAAAKQSALNSTVSKSHLAATVARGQGAVEVPDAVKAQYRLFYPEISDAEIRSHYSRFHKK